MSGQLKSMAKELECLFWHLITVALMIVKFFRQSWKSIVHRVRCLQINPREREPFKTPSPPLSSYRT